MKRYTHKRHSTFWGIYTVVYLNCEFEYHMCCVFLYTVSGSAYELLNASEIEPLGPI